MTSTLDRYATSCYALRTGVFLASETMRSHHTPHSLPAFPVYSCAFLSPDAFVLGGGGGASRSGIKNKLRLYTVNEKRFVELKDEFELEKGEDAPMSMVAHSEQKKVICGVNSAQEKLDQGDNQNCRVFSVDDKIRLLGTKSTLSSSDINDYQKVTSLSPDGRFLAIGGSHDVTVLSFPSLEPAAESIHTDKEIYDASFSSTNTLVLTTTHNLLVYDLPESSSSTTTTASSVPKKRKKLKTNTNTNPHLLILRQTLNIPSSIGEGGTFRSTRLVTEMHSSNDRFRPDDDSILYTTINASAPRSKRSRTTSRQCYVVKWDTKTWTVDKLRKIGDYGLTSFDTSPDGRFLAFGSSDLSIGVFDSRTLGPLISILKAFEFPPTFVKFNPTTSLLVSGSADNSIRIVSIPKDVASPSRRYLFSILALVILLLAIAISLYFVRH